ncbi:MAG: Y-family DNA polymerase [Alphaproteobacteria bacterium]
MKKRRIAAVWLPWFPAERLSRHDKTLARQKLVIIEEQRGRLVLKAVSRRAGRAGLWAGMALADARAVAPDLETRFAQSQADQLALRKLAGWATRYTPWASVGEGHTLVLDISGCGHLFGGEAALAQDMLDRLSAFGLTARIGVADTPGAAWAFAHYIDQSVYIQPSSETVADAMDALKDLPVAALRLGENTVDALYSFGLRTVGALYPLERRALTERFDASPVERLDQALGVADEPISPLQPVPPYHARLAFADPIGAQGDVEAALEALLENLCASLARAEDGARHLTLACHRLDGTVGRISLGTSRPSRWPQPLYRLFAERLDEIDPGFGIEVMVLAATRAEPLKAVQANWQQKGIGNEDGLAQLMDRLGNRFGFGHIARPEPRQSWLPERAVAQAGPFEAEPETSRWPGGRDRPLRLLSHPEPVEVTAPVPDDPPVLFRWHRRVFRVKAADGPERLEGEWWLKDQQPRDYYLVEDEEGCRYWLYREGLYDPERPPSWYLHGVFA